MTLSLILVIHHFLYIITITIYLSKHCHLLVKNGLINGYKICISKKKKRVLLNLINQFSANSYIFGTKNIPVDFLINVNTNDKTKKHCFFKILRK